VNLQRPTTWYLSISSFLLEVWLPHRQGPKDREHRVGDKHVGWVLHLQGGETGFSDWWSCGRPPVLEGRVGTLSHHFGSSTISWRHVRVTLLRPSADTQRSRAESVVRLITRGRTCARRVRLALGGATRGGASACVPVRPRKERGSRADHRCCDHDRFQTRTIAPALAAARATDFGGRKKGNVNDENRGSVGRGAWGARFEGRGSPRRG